MKRAWVVIGVAVVMVLGGCRVGGSVDLSTETIAIHLRRSTVLVERGGPWSDPFPFLGACRSLRAEETGDSLVLPNDGLPVTRSISFAISYPLELRCDIADGYVMVSDPGGVRGAQILDNLRPFKSEQVHRPPW
jgi:hypothetical protein